MGRCRRGTSSPQVSSSLFPTTSMPAHHNVLTTVCPPQCANIPGGESRFNGNMREHETRWCMKLAVNTGKRKSQLFVLGQGENHHCFMPIGAKARENLSTY